MPLSRISLKHMIMLFTPILKPQEYQYISKGLWIWKKVSFIQIRDASTVHFLMLNAFVRHWTAQSLSFEDAMFVSMYCNTTARLWPCPLWQKAVGSCGWWAMTGMGEMPVGRPLTLGGWPGEGVSAGDEGRLLYIQHTDDAERGNREETQTLSFKKKKKKKSNCGHFFLSQSHSVVQVIALMFHSIHISPTNVPLHPNAEDYFLLIFRFRQHSLHLQSLFTTTFNLPGTADKLSLAQGDNSHATVRRVQTN